MIESFPETGNRLIDDLWTKHVLPLYEQLDAKKKEYDSFQPPSPDQVAVFLANCTDENIVLLLDELNDLEDRISALSCGVTTYAIEKLQKPSNADQILATKRSFNELKKRLIPNLRSILIEAEHYNLVDAYQAAQYTLNQLPKLSGSSAVKNDLSEMRAWLKSQGYPVSDRGRIAQTLQDAFNNRSK